MEDRPPPPPYSLVASTTEEDSSSVNPRSLISYLHSHIAALPNRIRQTQQTHNAQQVEKDIWILDHLAPTVETFLADVGAQRKVPALATLTLVPKAAVPADAVLSGIDNMLRRNEVGRVFRVDIQPDMKKGDDDSKTTGTPDTTPRFGSNREFTDWGRWEGGGPSSAASGELLWWKDEELAQRLASYLQPQPKSRPKSTIQSSVQAVVERSIPAERAKKSWGMSWRKSNPNNSEAPSSSTIALPVTKDSIGSRPGTVESGDVAGIVGDQLDNGKRAEMDVTAENRAFRRENDFGIWESISGWAIVITVNIHT